METANLALNKQRGIIKCATGGGKTLIFTAILKAIEEKKKEKTLILMRNRSLVEQTYQVLTENGVSGVGRVNMDHFSPDIVTCATITSIHKIPEMVEEAKVVFLFLFSPFFIFFLRF